MLVKNASLDNRLANNGLAARSFSSVMPVQEHYSIARRRKTDRYCESSYPRLIPCRTSARSRQSHWCSRHGGGSFGPCPWRM